MVALAAAEALWKQGDHGGAWLAIEELEQIERVMPEAIDLTLGGSTWDGDPASLTT